MPTPPSLPPPVLESPSTVARPTLSIVPFDDPAAGRESSTFGEAIAYMMGVADALASRADARPLSLVPRREDDATDAAAGSLGSAPPAQYARLTLRFGEGAELSPGLAVSPRMASVPYDVPARGGARLVDLGSAPPTGSTAPTPAIDGVRRATLPYEAVAISLAPASLAPSRRSTFPGVASPCPEGAWSTEFDRPSGVRLRCAPLSREWYRLTGTDSGD